MPELAKVAKPSRKWPGISWSLMLRYGIALFSTGLAVWVRRLLDPVLGDQNNFPTILFAVLITAWYGGTRPALVAAISGFAFSDYFLIPPRGSFALKGPTEWTELALYLVVASGIAVLGGVMQAARLRSRDMLLDTQKTLSQTEERLRLALRSSGISVWSWDIGSNIIEADEHSSALFGLPIGQYPQTIEGFAMLLHPEDCKRVQHELSEAVEHGAEYNTEFRIQQPGGQVRILAARAKTYYGEDGRPRRLLGVCSDVTEERRAEKALQDSEKRLNEELQKSKAQAYESGRLNDLVEILQSCQTIEEACGILEKLIPTILACRAGALCLTNPSRNVVEAAAVWGDEPGTQRAFGPGECWALRRGKIHAVKDASSPVQCAHVTEIPTGGYLCIPIAAQGETLGVLYLEGQIGALPERSTTLMETLSRQASAAGERISPAVANLRLRELLRNQSIRDPLTGLFNRRYMEESLEREVCIANRKKHDLAVVMFDLDHFKRFNDTFGHDAGDLVLRQVANILRMRVRSSDMACRFGGEELVLILPESTFDMAFERTEAIRKDIKSLALRHMGQSLGGVTISAGIAMFPANGANTEQLLKASDQALYRAKEQGRDRVVGESPSVTMDESPTFPAA